MNAANSQSLTDRVQQLINQRQQHAEAIAAIDDTLQQINGLLSGEKPAKAPVSAKPAAAPAPAAAQKRRSARRQFATTGEQSILSLVKAKRNPTTKEINAHWKQEGRGSTADSLLGTLVKQGKLKRKPLGGKLGSQYVLP